MKTSIPIFCVLVLLLIGSGCTKSTIGELSVNETPAMILYYENANMSLPVNISQIEVRDPGNFTANVTSVITILFSDPRTGVLLENGWNITAVSGDADDHDPNRTYAEVEFKKEGLSFYIVVDDKTGRTLEGRCGAEWWISGSISGPLPQDYHQADDKSSGNVWVFDQKNRRVIMVYNQTTILFLSPSSGSPISEEFSGFLSD